MIWASRKYGSDPANIHALNHVYRHFTDNLTRPFHGVFTVPTNELVGLVDEAWIKVKNNTPGVVKSGNQTGNISYSVPMGRDIGKQGGASGSGGALNRIKIVIDRQKPDHIVTVYPE